MVELRPDDFTATKLFLLSHVDPLFVIEIADRAFRHSDAVASLNTLMFGTHVDAALRSLLRRLVAGALDERFLDDLLNVVDHSRINVDFAGFDVIRGLDSTFEVLEAPVPHNEQFAGAVRATDAACDLLLQPLMAFGNFFNALAGEWPKFAAYPDLAAQIRYRTNRSSYFEARIENRIRLELGLPTTLQEGPIANIP